MKRTLGILTVAALAGLSMTAAFAQDATTTTTTDTAKTTKKENVVRRGAGAVGHDTKKGIGAVEHGTETVVKDSVKPFKAVGKGMRKLVPFHHNKTTKTTTTTDTSAPAQ